MTMTEIPLNKTQEIQALAKELLADIELGRLHDESLVFKARRLARLYGDEGASRWLRLEMLGYDGVPTDRAERGRFVAAGRGAAKSVAPFAHLARQTQELLDRFRAMSEEERNLDLALSSRGKGPSIPQRIAQRRLVRTRVIALVHEFVVGVYHEISFSGMAETIFERYKTQVDARLADSCADVLKKLPAVYDRLADGDAEAIPQGLTTCRRMIDAFADAVYPPRDEPVTVDGKKLKVGEAQTKNRINTYIGAQVRVSPRRTRLRQTLENLYGRLCEGVHREVTAQEAQALVLQTYLFLGEVATLERKQSVATE